MIAFDEYLGRINRGYKENISGNVHYLSVPALDELGFLKNGFTTRKGGISLPPYDSLNLSFKRTKSLEETLENIRIAAEAMGMEYEDLIIANFVHGKEIMVVGKEERGIGITRPQTLPECDGLITMERNCVPVSMHADCCQIIFADRNGKAIGTLHSGWKGTSLRTVTALIGKMESLGIRREDIIFGIGPCISGKYYEIKEDVASVFRGEFPFAVIEREDKIFLDLQGILLCQLDEENIPPENVTVADLCTYEREDLFYSYRRDGKDAGVMGSFICYR
jgi:YfiH family protein